MKLPLLALSTVVGALPPTSFTTRHTSHVPKSLKFRKDGTFQISIFEDLHFGENAWDSWGPQQDINSVKVIEKVLDAENPSLVVLNGDLITGDNAFLQNATAVVDEIVGPIVARDLPWASTYGNHDYQYNLTGEAILQHENRYQNSLTRSMVPGRDAGVSNYYIPVMPDHCKSKHHCAPELILWFFDSRGGFEFQAKQANGDFVGRPNWVDVSVVNWFQQTHAALAHEHKKVIPSLAFVHIPTNASLALQTVSKVNPNYQPGINDDYPASVQSQGWCPDGTNSGCAYGGQDAPFMKALTQTPGLMAVFSGHDHGDTWCYRWDEGTVVPGMDIRGSGLNLCFGQHSGYGGYGSWIRGARQVLVSKEKLRNQEVDTWIRLESGSAVGRVSLNSTYGHDWYPATPNDKTQCPTC
ncbi:hypothetical protein NLU13_3912 [Sarocladium strictum]|uniref:Calcineurin-like phosphoesterase domain-containing protein n=1 Tax=Sarocladium strictum TaxID=5046 RepID=A0AA39GHX2_SARSR|nr:hypothetical protein NLU13_3912 [Sarocladium strictum]